MPQKKLMQITLFVIAMQFLVSLACISMDEVSSLIGYPSQTAVEIQEIVQETLKAYTALAAEATGVQAATPAPNNSTIQPDITIQQETPTISNPTETPTPTATPTPTIDYRGTCFQPYPFFPIRTDVAWHYQTQVSGTPPDEHIIRYQSISSDSFIANQDFESFTNQVKWLCSSQGLMQSQFTQQNIPGTPDGIEFETVNFSGVTIPVPEQFQIGSTWTSDYTIQGSMSTEVGEMTTLADVKMANSLTAMEEITVLFGTFTNAARVDSQVSMLISTQIGGFAGPPTEITLTISTWYVEGVGMVKSETRQPGELTTTELVSMQ